MSGSNRASRLIGHVEILRECFENDLLRFAGGLVICAHGVLREFALKKIVALIAGIFSLPAFHRSFEFIPEPVHSLRAEAELLTLQLRIFEELVQENSTIALLIAKA